MGINAATTYTVTSDVIGNPTNDGTWSYTWEKGRQLKQMSKSGTTATFKYNSEGLRVQKTVNGTVTNYTLHGKNIVHLTQGSNVLHFWYDASNRPAIVQFNGTKYAYIHNLQGDIVGILNTSGTEVVKYTYDAWGKVLSTTGSLASTLGTIQPFRYRGYVYDVETGLYYLRSRYYNPKWGRFINADALIKGNMFCYCENSPNVKVDYDGYDSIIDLVYEKVRNIVNTIITYCYFSYVNAITGVKHNRKDAKLISFSVETDKKITLDEQQDHNDFVKKFVKISKFLLFSSLSYGIPEFSIPANWLSPATSKVVSNIVNFGASYIDDAVTDFIVDSHSIRAGEYISIKASFQYTHTHFFGLFTCNAEYADYEIRLYGDGYQEVWCNYYGCFVSYVGNQKIGSAIR